MFSVAHGKAVRYEIINVENRLLLTDEPVEVEEQPVEAHEDFRKITRI